MSRCLYDICCSEWLRDSDNKRSTAATRQSNTDYCHAMRHVSASSEREPTHGSGRIRSLMLREQVRQSGALGEGDQRGKASVRPEGTLFMLNAGKLGSFRRWIQAERQCAGLQSATLLNDPDEALSHSVFDRATQVIHLYISRVPLALRSPGGINRVVRQRGQFSGQPGHGLRLVQFPDRNGHAEGRPDLADQPHGKQ